MCNNPAPNTHITLIGYGIWGQNILRDLVAMGCDITVIEPDTNKQQAAKKVGSIKQLSHLEIETHTDGFIIATPASSHFKIIRQLKNHSAPIFCEKPLTTDPAQAKQLLDQQNAIFVMHNWHYHSGVQALADIAASGELGQCLALHSNRSNWSSPRKDTDSLWTLMPHDLSISKKILGHIPKPRFAVAEKQNGNIVSMSATLGNKPYVQINISTRHRLKQREIRLHCEQGVAVLPSDQSDCIEITLDNQQQLREQPITEYRPFISQPALKTELEIFVRYLQGGPAPETDLLSGIENVNIIAQLKSLAEQV